MISKFLVFVTDQTNPTKIVYSVSSQLYPRIPETSKEVVLSLENFENKKEFRREFWKELEHYQDQGYTIATNNLHSGTSNFLRKCHKESTSLFYLKRVLDLNSFFYMKKLSPEIKLYEIPESSLIELCRHLTRNLHEKVEEILKQREIWYQESA